MVDFNNLMDVELCSNMEMIETFTARSILNETNTVKIWVYPIKRFVLHGNEFLLFF